MRNNGLFSTIFISEVKQGIKLDDHALGRMATLGQTWRSRDHKTAGLLWNSFMKQALSYLQFVPPNASTAPGVYPLYEDWAFSHCLSVLYLIEPDADIDDTAVGRFWPAKLLKELRKQKLNWGILTDGAKWRLYSTKSSRPYEDCVELSLAEVLEKNDEGEYGLFERFFHKDSFIPEKFEVDDEEKKKSEGSSVYKCRLDRDKEDSEKLLEEYVKNPLLYQIDEILQYLCNGFIADTTHRGDEYTEEERRDIFESSVKLLYRCLFLFYAEARRLLPSEVAKVENYSKHSIRALCREAHKFQWGKRKDYDGFDLWKHLKGLTNAVNDGDTDYGIMGYNGGLFDDEQEKFLGRHRLRNDSLSRALYLLAYVESYKNNPDDEHEIPYEDLEVRHLGELYENILEYTVLLADADHIRRRTKKGVEVLLASEATRQKGDTLIKKGDVYFGETALERKQTGSYYTPEPLVRFLNTKAVVGPLRERFEKEYRKRFNEFLDQASSVQDEGARRGAIRSAVAIVERFVNDVVLDFKVCDPAMGSGHFLVDAANQMAGLVVELLAEIPSVKGLSTKVTSNPNGWRRLITRNCLYGVDLNPLAVDLAKLSLWLNCFAINHKLTFLDHHLRCGNSLIGIRTLDQLKNVPTRKNEKERTSKQQVLPYFEDLSNILTQASNTIEAIPDIEEDDTDRQKAVFEKVHESTFVRLDPLADLYTAYLMDTEINEEQYRELFSKSARGRMDFKIVDSEFKNLIVKIEDYKARHQFFHWVLEFPDVFKRSGKVGFDAAIGNPPWDVLQPNTQEFYSKYIPEFRRLRKQDALKRIKEIHKKHPEIGEKWSSYELQFKVASSYCKEPQAFSCLNEGKIDLYKAFLEKFFQIICRGGTLGIVVPSGLYTDQSSQPLRKLFLENTQIKFLFGFENRWPSVFNAVDNRFKFVLFSALKGAETINLKCAFMLHDPEKIEIFESTAVSLDQKQIKDFSPNSLSLIEFRNNKEIEICKRLTKFGHLGDFEGVRYSREFNLTTDGSLFVERRNEQYELFEGKHINQFDSDYLEREFGITYETVCEEFKRYGDKFPPDEFRWGLREIAASTNERTCICSVLPLRGCHTYTICSLRPEQCKQLFLKYYLNSHESILALTAIANSFCYEFFVRRKITNHLSTPFYEFPAPPEGVLFLYRSIIARTARLICTAKRYEALWQNVFDEEWSDTKVWYPQKDNGRGDLNCYGPKHEMDIRQKLMEGASSMRKKWNYSCGVYNRMQDRRDTGDRAQLRAEIDAYVTHLYGLNREEFTYILDTFPVLKRKEEKAFGEYVSKRKCLEEYDRIASIL